MKPPHPVLTHLRDVNEDVLHEQRSVGRVLRTVVALLLAAMVWGWLWGGC